jgi:endonuclease G
MNEYRYQNGMAILEVLIEPDDTESRDSFDLYKANLLRHLKEHRNFGDSDSTVNRDIANLNHLARDVYGHSFNDLCVGRRDIERTLIALLRKLPADRGRQVAARIYYNENRITNHRISEDKTFLQELSVRYQIPMPADASPEGSEIGPPIDWRGPDEFQLQGFFRPLPDMLDMGLLKQAVDRSSAICLVSIPSLDRSGTGFLIAPGQVLTNYHVLKASEQEDMEANARAAKLSFGYLTGDPGLVPSTFKLTDRQPILSWSPACELDYVLLQVDDKNRALETISPVPYVLSSLAERSALYILQHPQGEPMKLAIDANGVTGVYPQDGRVQYVTRTSPGSSGSPCFNEDWKVVALHHAERSKAFGSIREGILFSQIYDRIAAYLT